MLSTMQDRPLLVSSIVERARSVYGESEVVDYSNDIRRSATIVETVDRIARLARGLRALGVEQGDCVGTLCWNTIQHLEAYFAVPSIGAVLHTLNLRLSPEQLSYVINHAGNRVVIVDESLVPLLTNVLDELTTVERFIVVGDAAGSGLPNAVSYEDLVGNESPIREWPDFDERSAAAICHTTGTTGNPKGVVYSHRSIYLHTLGLCTGAGLGFTEHDRVFAMVPMFHANAWGLPYAAWMMGCDFVLPGRLLGAEAICKIVKSERITVAGAVPTVWGEVLRYGERNDADLSSLRVILCGGAAVSRSLMERFEERYGVPIIQAWGMTETSPAVALAYPHKLASESNRMDWRSKSGRVLPCCELRIVDDSGAPIVADGQSVGEIQVRGPWITGAYLGGDSPEKFVDGWLCTGDVGTFDERGYLQITDRSKDVIKSGGEWISSVELENHVMAHPDVVEAAVIGVPDPKWDERPLACVVLKAGSEVKPDDFAAFLSERVSKWWIPERWAFIEQVPRTSVGKFDKKALRSRFSEDGLQIVTCAKPVGR
jgi:fatty-acyl-CoA synthase